MNGTGRNIAGCATCAGGCCREYRVEVNVAGLRKIAAGTGFDPTDFLYLREDEEGFQLAPHGPPMSLNLIKRPKSGACVFLMEIAPGKARCGIYAHRPLVCSNFPMILRRGTVSVREDSLCGGSDAWNLAAMDVAPYRRDLLRNTADWAENQRIAKEWNADLEENGREASAEELYSYLLALDLPEQA